MTMSNPLTRRLMDLLASIPWNPGESLSTVVRRHYETHGALPASWAHLEEKIVRTNFSLGFTTPCRWKGDQPARVITGGSLQLVIHPWLDRTITHRETARVLGFPDDWKIEPLKNLSGLSLTWGKGISVHCGKWIGEWIHRALDGAPGTHVGDQLTEREWNIDVTNAWKSSAGQRRDVTTNVVQ